MDHNNGPDLDCKEDKLEESNLKGDDAGCMGGNSFRHTSHDSACICPPQPSFPREEQVKGISPSVFQSVVFTASAVVRY